MSHAVEPDSSDVYVITSLNRLAEHWGLVLAYGLVTLGLGVAMMVWPDQTIAVFAVLIAIQLIIGGIFRIVQALGMSTFDVGMRAIFGLTGGVALVVGLLVLREPLQSVLVLGMILGVWWLISGLIDVIGAIVSPGTGGRGWEVAIGVVSMLAGGFLIVYTDLSLTLLIWFVAIWLVLAGVFATLTAFRLRSQRVAS
ncbi:HdeD family acid-resistance protein [Nocardioides caricicola]|uniref:HdeD family acid-resistance protein n=1 Tax=Nocardioides caricicola TaxID=634770 RepID=A0ABW0N0E0_9ACTN